MILNWDSPSLHSASKDNCSRLEVDAEIQKCIRDGGNPGAIRDDA
jgi:hypothetical protein